MMTMMNSNKLLVIVDASGSMNEWGKLDLIINLLVTINQNSNCEFILWNEELKKIEELDFNEHSIKFTGDCKLDILYDFLENNYLGYNKLLLSDGHINIDKKLDFSKFNVNCIQCGVDSFDTNLNNIFGTKAETPSCIIKNIL